MSCNKFEVNVRYKDTGIKVSLIPNILKFTDGTIRVSFDSVECITNIEYLCITSYIESMDDLMVVAQIKDIFSRHSDNFTSMLEITSPIYTRYDRVMLDDKSDSFALKVFADFVNSLNFDKVYVYDAHSEVTLQKIKNSENFNQSLLFTDLIGNNYSLGEYDTIAPDKGAIKKNPEANYVFDKTRDLSTGKIIDFKLDKKAENPKEVCFVVDDLCEGGGTFLAVADVFNEKCNLDNKISLNLYVTHGVFTNNAVMKLLDYYDNIFVYFIKESVYNELSDGLKNNLFVMNIIKGV